MKNKFYEETVKALREGIKILRKNPSVLKMSTIVLKKRTIVRKKRTIVRKKRTRKFDFQTWTDLNFPITLSQWQDLLDRKKVVLKKRKAKKWKRI